VESARAGGDFSRDSYQEQEGDYSAHGDHCLRGNIRSFALIAGEGERF